MDRQFNLIGGYQGAAAFLSGVAFMSSLYHVLSRIASGKRGSFGILSWVIVGVCWILMLHLFIASRH